MAGAWQLVFLCVAVGCWASPEEGFKAPNPSGSVHFAENFQDADAGSLPSGWVKSAAMKDGADADIAKYDGEWSVESAEQNSLETDVGLVLKDKAKHAAVSAPLATTFEFTDKPLVFQYDLKLQQGMDCGGSYIKLLSHSDSLDLAQVTDKTPYTIMFGPDSCGTENKLHFIFRHKSPKTGEFEEKHADLSSVTLPDVKDKKTHLLRLVVRPDNTFTISIDRVVLKSGSLLEDMRPAVNPPAEIDDPEDKRPEDWDDKEKIPDPEASKPDDWDEDAPSHIPDDDASMPSDWLVEEPQYVEDPEADKPEDWDVDEDGEYEAPKIDNPKCAKISGCGPWTRPTKVNPAYKGKWRAPMIDNPNYQGIWKPKKIANPDFFEDLEPFKMSSIGAIGVELWTMTAGQLFDNIILTDDEAVADQYAADSFDAKTAAEAPVSTAHGLLTSLMSSAEERPWLWAVYAIVIVVLPVVLIVGCCLPSKKDDGDADRRARAKKTDEHQPDDPAPANVEEEVDSDEEAAEDEVVEEEVPVKKASPAPAKASPAPAKASPAPAKASPAPAKASPAPAKASPSRKGKKADVKVVPEPEVEPPRVAALEPEPEIASAPSASAAASAEQELGLPDAAEDEPRRSPRKPTKKKVRREN
ncbi:calnexin-like isoform X1 [Sycon ciliatum]|uniref:calnexin-like isoform X1 n=1 Tax=Sycon ciliatum TaxID=27933 RepID=UPI0031F65F41